MRISSCLHPRSVPGCGLGKIGPLNCGTRLLFFRRSLQFVLPIPPLLGDGGGLGILATPTVAQDCVTSCFLDFGGTILPRPPRSGCGGTSVFRFSVDTFSPRPPSQVIWRWFSSTLFLSLTDKPPFFPFFLAFLVGFVVSPFRDVGVGCVEPHLRLMF